jgi:hypothetical protein
MVRVSFVQSFELGVKLSKFRLQDRQLLAYLKRVVKLRSNQADVLVHRIIYNKDVEVPIVPKFCQLGVYLSRHSRKARRYTRT